MSTCEPQLCAHLGYLTPSPISSSQRTRNEPLYPILYLGMPILKRQSPLWASIFPGFPGHTWDLLSPLNENQEAETTQNPPWMWQ